MNTRHRSKTALICFLLCIPLAFIALFAYIYITEDMNAGEISAVNVETPDGRTYSYGDSENVAFYVDMLVSSSKLSVPLRETEGARSVAVKCDRGDKILTYTVYPELSLTGCMYSAPDGKFYLISEETAKLLLSRPEYAYLYTASSLPALNVVSGAFTQAVIPKSYEWQYKRMDGSFAACETSPEGLAVCSVYSDRANSLSFAVQPDDVTVTVTDSDGNILGTTDIGSLVYPRDTSLKVKVTAVWSLKSASAGYGTASYEFDLLYDIPAVFSVETEEARIGSYIVLDVRHLNKDEKVTLSSSATLSEPVFTENEGVMTAVIGIGDNNEPGVYDVNYTVGDNSGTFRLTLTGTPRSERGGSNIARLDLSAERYEALLSDSAMSALDDFLNNACVLSADSAVFAKPAASGFGFEQVVSGEKSVAFGQRVLVYIGGAAENKVTYSIGEVYASVPNARVKAAARGKVIMAGTCDSLGNYVVVSHGFGVCTWYCFLGEADSVAVGTEVMAGDIIGYCGTSPFTENTELLFCVSAGKTFIGDSALPQS